MDIIYVTMYLALTDLGALVTLLWEYITFIQGKECHHMLLQNPAMYILINKL